jgi:hypothetical protein
MKNYINKSVVGLGLLLLFGFSLKAQTNNAPTNAKFDIGQGLVFNFNNGDYQFKIGGMIQPQLSFKKDTTADPNYFLNSKRTFFNIAGKAAKEKISFLLQTDFSQASPLMDAWVAYTPSKYLKLTVGQQLTFTNNKEMGTMETHLQFIDRSMLSTQLSNTGREFGLFIETNFTIGNMVLAPKAAITSGDGRNSFGTSVTDYDLGGVKYAGRIDADGNDQLIADIKNEPKPKLALGAAGSYNNGASQLAGEGHGNFILYDAKGLNKLPDYRKLYYDVLFKFKGFSALAEFAITTAKVEQGTFLDATSLNLLEPTEISELLALGNGYNAQVGYVYKRKYGIDVRYASLTREFNTNANSILKDQSEITYGLTKYVNENNIKITASATHLTVGNSQSLLGTFYVQVIF